MSGDLNVCQKYYSFNLFLYFYMKILFILDLYKPHIWGVEILFENLINWLISQWHKVKVLTSRYTKELSTYEQFDNGIEIYRVGHNRYDFMLYCLRKGINLAKRADIIHTTTYNSAIPASIISKISGKRVVLTVHEIFGKLRYRFMWWKWFFYKIFESLIFKFDYDKYICVSNYTKNNLRIYFWLPDHKLITVYNGIDYNHWDKKNFVDKDIQSIRTNHNLQKNYVWLFFWRPGISKWLIYFVKAIPHILKEIPHFKAILIVGESPNNKADDVREFISHHHLKDYIVWLPGVKYKELGNYILTSDVVCVPSLVEGFGFSAAETCALGQQLVVTNVASLTEVVSGKINFIEPANEEDIAQKIIDFYKGEYKNIAEKKFLWSDNVEKILDVYSYILWK